MVNNHDAFDNVMNCCPAIYIFPRARGNHRDESLIFIRIPVFRHVLSLESGEKRHIWFTGQGERPGHGFEFHTRSIVSRVFLSLLWDHSSLSRSRTSAGRENVSEHALIGYLENGRAIAFCVICNLPFCVNSFVHGSVGTAFRNEVSNVSFYVQDRNDKQRINGHWLTAIFRAWKLFGCRRTSFQSLQQNGKSFLSLSQTHSLYYYIIIVFRFSYSAERKGCSTMY